MLLMSVFVVENGGFQMGVVVKTFLKMIVICMQNMKIGKLDKFVTTYFIFFPTFLLRPIPGKQ